MLEVTQDALRFSLRALLRRRAPADACMRLSRDATSGLELSPDHEQADDRSYDLAGRTVLVVERSLADELSGQQLFVDGAANEAAQLRLQRLSEISEGR